MIIKDKFNQTLTKAAFMIMEELREEVKKCNIYAFPKLDDQLDEAHREQEEMFCAAYTMKSNILHKAMLQLRIDIENQAFDY